MLALKLRPSPRACLGTHPEVLAEALQEGVNLAVWQRRLPAQVEDFVRILLAQPLEVSESVQIEVGADEQLRLPALLRAQADFHGYDAFVADLTWLVEAFACLLGARRIGLRLRSLAKPMCPRFHVDHVPLRLITSYAGVGSDWLEEGAMPRSKLGQPGSAAEDHGNTR